MTIVTDSGRVDIGDEHDVVLARREAMRVASVVGLDRRATYQLATAVTELAMNLVLHAVGARTVVIEATRAPRTGVLVTSRDEGPGIPDLDRAMQDGFSTGGGLGSGLPGARRLMDAFEIESSVAPGGGTLVRAWKWRS